MMLYAFYRIAVVIALFLPLRTSYAIATGCAFLFYKISPKDRRAVINNLKVVTGGSADEKTIDAMAREVFKNFAKYLIDFFRAQKIDEEFIRANVKIVGLHNMEKARAMGKGVIALSAHVGNWELGGAALATIGYPISAVVLTHKNKLINDFFTHQRLNGNMRPIEMGASLKACYRALKNNEVLALLGDRDFTGTGLQVDFFGHPAMMPKGPALFSYRLGAPIVPVFMVRESDDSFTFFMKEPILCDTTSDEKTAVREVTVKCSKAIEECIKRYPAQWYAFREIWDGQ